MKTINYCCLRWCCWCFLDDFASWSNYWLVPQMAGRLFSIQHYEQNHVKKVLPFQEIHFLYFCFDRMQFELFTIVAGDRLLIYGGNNRRISLWDILLKLIRFSWGIYRILVKLLLLLLGNFWVSHWRRRWKWRRTHRISWR